MNRQKILDAVRAGDPAAVFLDMRVRGLYSPYYFVKTILQREKLSAKYHLPELERFTDLLAAGVRRQAIEWARGHFKTTCFTQGVGPWLVCPVRPEDREYAIDVVGIDPEKWDARAKLHNQDLSQLLAFENVENAKLKLLEIQWHFEQNQIFRQCYPEIAYRGDEKPWNSEAMKIRRTPKAAGVGESTFNAIGVEGALQSRHYDVLWGDDLVGKAAVESDVTMEKTVRWWGLARGALRGAALGIDSYEFLISNRWGFNDLNSVLRAGGMFSFHTRSLYEPDPETGEDRIAFPEHFTWKLVDEIRNDVTMTARDFSCQYMNNPIPPGDAAVDIGAIHQYRVEPDGTMICSCGQATTSSQLVKYMHYDPYNAKGRASRSAPAIAVVGLSYPKHVWLIDYYVAKEQTASVVNKLIEFNDVYRPEMFTYEDVGQQNWIEFHLREKQRSEEFRAAKHRKFPVFTPSKTGNKAMEVRVRERLVPHIEAGHFTVRARQRAFVDMWKTFPHPVSGHDYDLLDALAQGPEVWSFPVDEVQAATLKARAEEQIREMAEPYTVMAY